MWETSSKVGSIYVDLPELGQVDLLTSGAENLEPGGLESITESHWKHLLLIAESSGTVAIDT
jgi:hypothetical protein